MRKFAGIIVIIAVGLYFLTESMLDKSDPEPSVTDPKISANTTIIGQMFDKPEDEYFVLAYDSNSNLASFYNFLFMNFEDEEDNIKIYFVDLGMGFNSFALAEESNPKPRNAEEVKINEVALFRIKKGKVIDFFETAEDIRNALS